MPRQGETALATESHALGRQGLDTAPHWRGEAKVLRAPDRQRKDVSGQDPAPRHRAKWQTPGVSRDLQGRAAFRRGCEAFAREVVHDLCV